MKLHAESVLPFPREVVYRTYRDRLVELVPFLPNIRGIEVRSRADEGSVSRLVNVWHGGGDIPSVARAFLSERMLSWTDHATWDEAAWTCAWRMESHSFREAVHAAGKNAFLVDGDGCRLVIDGDLTIDGKKLPVPRFLAGTVAPAVEKFLVGMIRPNLTEVARGVERFLAASGAR
jgi:hypothetical protein